MKKMDKTIENKKDAILTAILMAGIFLVSVGGIMYSFSEEKTLYSGTVVSIVESDGKTILGIDTDGNKDSIENVIEVKRNDDDALYVGKAKVGSKIKFKPLKGIKWVSNIYQIDDFIVRKR